MDSINESASSSVSAGITVAMNRDFFSTISSTPPSNTILYSNPIFLPFLLAASAKRFRGLGLNPRATLLYLVVPAPYMALILIALGPAPLDKETPNDEENEVAPNADESEKTTSKAEENADA